MKRGIIEVKTNIGKNIKRKTDKRKHNGKQNTKGPFIFLWERWVLRFGVVSFGNDPPKPLLIFLILLEWAGEKEAPPELRQAFEVAAAQTSGSVNLALFCQSGLFECKHLFIDKPMVITKPAVPTTRLGLFSKLYPAKMLRLVNKDLSYWVFLEYAKIEQAKERLCWQGFPFRSFCRPKWQTSIPFPLSYTWSLIEVSLSGGASPFRH